MPSIASTSSGGGTSSAAATHALDKLSSSTPSPPPQHQPITNVSHLPTPPMSSAVSPSSAATTTAAPSSIASSPVSASPPPIIAGEKPSSKPTSFFSFVSSELFVDDSSAASSTDQSQLPSQLVYNFLILPLYLERLFTLGFMICLDCFLHLFTVLPFRMGVALLALMRSVLFPFLRSPTSPLRFRIGVRLNGTQLCDLCRGLLLVTCWCGLAFINMSRLYHYIRGQSVLKLYVIFNMLQISDRLFCSFGEDILESLFASIMTLASSNNASTTATSTGKKASHPTSKPVQILHVLFHFTISMIYVFGHSLLLFAQVITLNVSVNSDNSSLFVVLVSNNFIELKGAVFKRFDHHNLMQISASDIVERFQLTIFLLVIIVQNLAHIGLAFAGEWLEKAGLMCFMVLGGEWVVDWIKHGFITKFNGIPPIVYRHFGKVLCTDFIHTYKHKTEQSIHSVSRRLGLPSLPLAVMVVRVGYQAFLHSPSHILVKSGLLLTGFACLALLKCLLTIVLLGHSSQRVIIEPLEKEKAEAYKEALAAPAHQHLHTKKAPSPHAVVAHHQPPLAQSRSSALHPTPLQIPLSKIHSASPPLPMLMERGVQLMHSHGHHPNHANEVSFTTSVSASSTHSSPSLFGMKEPTKGKNQQLLSPFSLDGSNSSTPQKRSPRETPRDTSFPLAASQLFASHPPLVTATKISPSSAASVSTTITSPPSVPPSPAHQSTEDRNAAAPTRLVIPENRSSTPPNDSLTARFGPINTPTALERYAASALSPDAASPQVLTQTVTLQLPTTSDAIQQQHFLAAANAALLAATSGAAAVVDENDDVQTVALAPIELGRHQVSNGASSTSADEVTPVVSSTPITLLSSMSADQTPFMQLPAKNANETTTTNVLHIYHHQLPALAVDSAVSNPAHANPASAVSANVESNSATPAPVSYPPTVVTINSSVKEKGQPSYDDASKIEQDLLKVQRYKISANKAIPV